MKHNTKILPATAFLTVAGASLARSPARARGFKPGAEEPALAEVRRATTRFADVAVALVAGYHRDPGNPCETADMIDRPAAGGAKSGHCFRPDLLSITAPRIPAAENLVFEAARAAAGNAEPPICCGDSDDPMKDDPATEFDAGPIFALHCERHVLAHRASPKGVFAQYTPRVTCPHHYQGQHACGN